jgi:integrase
MPIGISIPKGRSCYYLRGTVTVGRRSRRVYETTGIRVGKAGSRALAEEVRLTREVQIRDELLHGTALTKTWLDLAVTYCEKRQKKRIEKDPSLKDHPDPEAGYVLRLTNFFSRRGMADVPLGELEEKVLNDFFTEALKDRKLSYKARHRDTYRTMMNLAQRLKWVGGEFPLPDLPRYDIAKEPVGKSLEDEDVRLFVMLAPKYARAYVASVFSTGLRGGELLFLKRTRPDYTDRLGTGLCLDQGNEHFFLGTTKDGAPILRALSDDLVMLLKSYLDSRTDKHNALFVTHRGVPYRRPRAAAGRSVQEDVEDRGGASRAHTRGPCRRTGNVRPTRCCHAPPRSRHSMSQGYRTLGPSQHGLQRGPARLVGSRNNAAHGPQVDADAIALHPFQGGHQEETCEQRWILGFDTTSEPATTLEPKARKISVTDRMELPNCRARRASPISTRRQRRRKASTSLWRAMA